MEHLSYTNNGFYFAGIPCQRWDMQTPHSHTITADVLGLSHLSDANNYCRNPSIVDRDPYCYSADPLLGMASCGILPCGKYASLQHLCIIQIIVTYL